MSNRITKFTCHDCKKHIRHVIKGGCGGTGYAVVDGDEENKICYACCGKRDAKEMKETGAMVLYLTTKEGKGLVVSNWPGTLEFRVIGVRNGKHFVPNSGFTTRQDVWFIGPDGKEWHGVQRGEWNDLCRCHRLKRQGVWAA